MKKLGLIVMVSAFFLTSCGSKNNQTETSSSVSSRTTSITSEQMISATSIVTSKESETTETSTMTSMTSNSDEVQSDPLSGYTDDQIEYVRVWLAVMGTYYKTDLANGEFELHVTRLAAGAPVNPYDENSLTYPNEIIMLSGKHGYQSLIVYSSNHNSSITYYPSPSHFPSAQEGQGALKKQEQDILNKASIISIPTGNPEDIKELIAVMKIDN